MLTPLFPNGRYMRTFFYMPRQLPCGKDCHWQDCPHGYLSRLQSASDMKAIQVIDNEEKTAALMPEGAPQHGDIVVMFAGDAHGLELLIRDAEFFEFTRNILVFTESSQIDASRCHYLGPRFITQTDRDIEELGAVIARMQKRSVRMDRHSEVRQ